MRKDVALYKLKDEYNELYETLLETADEDGVVDEVLAERLNEIQCSFEEKAVSVACVYRKFDTFENDIDAEIKRLQDMKKQVAKRKESVKNYLSNQCQAVGLKSIDGVYAKISFIKSKKCIIDDLNAIPEDYMRTTIKKEPNVAEIKKALNEGADIQFAHLEEIQNIQIK